MKAPCSSCRGARLTLPAASSLAFLVLGAGCSGASSSDASHKDAGPTLSEASLSDASLSDAPGEDAAPSPEAGSNDAGGQQDAEASGPVPVIMNDVSILFPLPSSAADIANLLTPSAAGDRGPLVPTAAYAANPIAGSIMEGNVIVTQVDGGGPYPAAYANLRVVAMRIDPCFAALAPDPHGAGCTAQLRLIFQQVTSTAGTVQAFDSALHAFYVLTRQELYALAAALVDLRLANTSGDSFGPLAPHPILIRQGLGGAMGKGLEQLIVKYAGAQNLVRLAQLSSTVGGVELGPFAWSMSAVDVADGGAATTPFSIPTLEADGGRVTVQQISDGIGSPFAMPDAGPLLFHADFLPATTSPDSFTALDDRHSGDLSPSNRQAALDGLVRIENPADDTANTIDCASCHLATPTQELLAMPVFSFDDTSGPLAFAPDGKTVTQADMAMVTAANDSNIHAFSYVETTPAINRRVIDETAAVVEYLNQNAE